MGVLSGQTVPGQQQFEIAASETREPCVPPKVGGMLSLISGFENTALSLAMQCAPPR